MWLRRSPPYRCSRVALDLDTYRERAERFLEALDRAYYRHLAGLEPELEIEPVYAEHGELFERDTVLALREAREAAGVERPGLGRLLQFALEGHLGLRTRREAEECARLEASLEVEVAGARHPYRGVPVLLANEPDAGRRAELEAARNVLLAEPLGPLQRAALERAHDIVRDLGWPSYAAAFADLRGFDLEALRAEAEGLLEGTADAYGASLAPELRAAGLPPLGELRRSDLPRFFRAPALDGPFTVERLVRCFSETLAGMGIDLDAQSNVHLDTERRPTKSPRAFCATPRVPDEIYLVIAPAGGREDFAALFHEGGHAEHYAHVDPGLAFEDRRLGDNTVTESFAFLFEHLTEDAEWLRRRLGVTDPEPIRAHARAVLVLMLRRYAAKLGYELELHGAASDLDAMPRRYSELLGAATRVEWPDASWLADVDEGFYVACYLRAWALELRWRAALRERFGELWFEDRGAADWLRGLWRQGQGASGEELLAEATGERLTLSTLTAELAPDPLVPLPWPG